MLEVSKRLRGIFFGGLERERERERSKKIIDEVRYPDMGKTCPLNITQALPTIPMGVTIFIVTVTQQRKST